MLFVKIETEISDVQLQQTIQLTAEGQRYDLLWTKIPEMMIRTENSRNVMRSNGKN